MCLCSPEKHIRKNTKIMPAAFCFRYRRTAIQALKTANIGSRGKRYLKNFCDCKRIRDNTAATARNKRNKGALRPEFGAAVCFRFKYIAPRTKAPAMETGPKIWAKKISA